MTTTKEDLQEALDEKCIEAGKLREALELAKERLEELERFTKYNSSSTLSIIDEALSWEGLTLQREIK